MDVTFRPLALMPPEFHVVHWENDRFKAAYSDTLWVLERELDHLGARDCVIEAGFRESDIRIDGLPRANAPQPTMPGVVVSFRSTYGPLRYGTDAFPRWQSNLRAIALGLEALRKVDRYGIGKRGEQYQGWKALPAGDDPSGERGRALIAEHGTVRAALHATHPDHGGNARDFADVQQAREEGAS